LGLDVLANYVALNPESQARNITAWTPVCAEILQGFCSFEDEAVSFSIVHSRHALTSLAV
jgi:brefeldin A-inhibited guanine nucleotide-exchange protein